MKVWGETRYLHSFKVPLRYVLTSKGKIVTLQGKIQQKPPFKWSSSTSLLIRHMTSCTLDMMLWEEHITSAVFLSKTQDLSLRMRKHQTHRKWGTCYKTLTNTLQKGQDHKAKDRLKNCHRLEAIKEPWKLNGNVRSWNRKKGMSGKAGDIWIRSVV